MDTNLVEIWLRKDPARWMAGALAGVFAGLVMMAFGALLCGVLGVDPLFPIKLAAAPILGSQAMEYGFHLPALCVGLVLIETVATFLGVAYAHFTGTNSLPPLLGMGVVWGVFGWIFINNLFFQSFKVVFHTGYSYGAAFPIWVVYGLALTSVAFFDRMVRGQKR